MAVCLDKTAAFYAVRKKERNMSEEQKENIQAGNPLGEASVASLMVKFAVPSIIAMIVSA